VDKLDSVPLFVADCTASMDVAAMAHMLVCVWCVASCVGVRSSTTIVSVAAGDENEGHF